MLAQNSLHGIRIEFKLNLSMYQLSHLQISLRFWHITLSVNPFLNSHIMFRKWQVLNHTQIWVNLHNNAIKACYSMSKMQSEQFVSYIISINIYSLWPTMQHHLTPFLLYLPLQIYPRSHQSPRNIHCKI